MPGDPKECRENAKCCLEMARTSRTKADRERFEGLAQRWLALASDFETANRLLQKWSTWPVPSGHCDPARSAPDATAEIAHAESTAAPRTLPEEQLLIPLVAGG
jgi:hypothetical protein